MRVIHEWLAEGRSCREIARTLSMTIDGPAGIDYDEMQVRLIGMTA